LGLAPNEHVVSDASNVYMTSMYHQLHCLNKIQVLLTAVTTVGPPKSVSLAHIEHCFSYLRQGILCAGDLTLEGPDMLDGKVQQTLQGWNVTHTCSDWDEMRRWMKEHTV
jgi:hypothetical protein